MSNVKKVTLIFSIILAFIIIVFAVYAIFFSAPKTEESTPVETTTVQIGDIEQTTFADGETVSKKSRTIYSSAAGTVTELHVAENWDVAVDDLLFVVDTGFRDEEITAPISGTVTDISVAEGTAVTTAQPPLATIQDVRDLQIEGQISEFDRGLIEEGQRVYVTFSAIDDEVQGSINFVSQAPIESLSTTPHYKFIVALDEIPEDLLIGMTASIEIVLEEKSDALLLDRDFLINRSGNTYVLQNGQEVLVETGLEADDLIEITSGLRQGDVVEKEVVEEEEPELLFGPNAS